MKTIQIVEKQKSTQDRKEVLIKKIQEIAESDQFARIDIERHFAEIQNNASRKESGNVICDLIDDREALQTIASLLYYKFKLKDLITMIDRAKNRIQNKTEALDFHMLDRYRLADGSSFHIDYDQFCIIEGISPQKREVLKEMVDTAIKLVNCTDEQLLVLGEHNDELSEFEKDLIQLLTSPEGDEVKATCEKLLCMTVDELKQFEKRENREPLCAITQILIELKR